MWGMNVHIALLPTNGRSYFREQQNIVGNMDEREAADLVAGAGVKTIVPIHYDMFSGNLGRPGGLVEYVRDRHPDLTCVVPAYGKRVTYVR